jgi:hypothetical protein
MSAEFNLEWELKPYHERILSMGPPADAPDIDKTAVHEIGNYIQPLMFQYPRRFGEEIKQELERFHQSIKGQEESDTEKIKEKISDLGQEYIDNDSVDEVRFRMIEAALESAEDYHRMLQGKKTGPVELEEVLSPFSNWETIDVKYNDIDPEAKISAGMEYWVGFNTLWKNTKDHYDRDGQVEINVRKDQNTAIIEYTDSGSGIPESERQDLFELGAEQTGLKTLSEIVSYNYGWVNYNDMDDDWRIEMYIPTSN